MGFLTGFLGKAPVGAAMTDHANVARRRLAHRGAGAGAWALQPRGRGHALLLSSATRVGPAVSVAFDGRLTNRTELLAELRQLGHALRPEADGHGSARDAAVLEAAWLCWGEEMLLRLEGAFALALLDARSGRVMLARDRFGQRPMLIAMDQDAVCFASELEALLAWPGPRREFDPEVLSTILAFGHAPVGASPMAGVRRLAPGHMLVAHPDGEIEERVWWELPPASAERPSPDMARRIEAVIRAQLSTEPAVLLDLGDATGLLAASLEPGQPAPAEIPQPDPALVQAMIRRQGEPIVPELLLPALAAGAHGRTVLAPTGGGELMLTHRRYRLYAQALAGLRDAGRRGVLPLDGGFHAAPLSPRELWHTASGGMSEADRLAILGPALLHTVVLAATSAYGSQLCEPKPGHVMAEAAGLDLTLRIPARDLAAFDVAASLTGANFVCPFLHGGLMTELAGQPDAARRWLMRTPLASAPDLAAWNPMAPGLREMTQDTLLSAACRERDLFSPGRIEGLLRKHAASPSLDTSALWALLGVELWCQAFLDTSAQDADSMPDDLLPELASVAA